LFYLCAKLGIFSETTKIFGKKSAKKGEKGTFFIQKAKKVA